MSGKSASPKVRVADLGRLRKMLQGIREQEQRHIDAGNVEVYPRSQRASMLKDAEALERVLSAFDS